MSAARMSAQVGLIRCSAEPCRHPHARLTPFSDGSLVRFITDLAERILLDAVGHLLVQGGELLGALVRSGVPSGDAAKNAGGFAQEPCGKLGMGHDVRCLLGPGFLRCGRPYRSPGIGERPYASRPEPVGIAQRRT
jgi:hypothetical protein